MAVAGLTWWHAMHAAYDPSPHALHRLMDRPRERLTIRGVIRDDPIKETSDRDPSRWRLTLQLTHVNRRGHFEPARGRVEVQWPYIADAPAPQYGDDWSFTGIVQDRRATHWRWSHLPPYRLRMTRADPAERLAQGRGNPVKRFSFAARRHGAQVLQRGLADAPLHAGILRALLLGYRHELPYDQHRLFALTGTLHIFAVSGLHIGIVAAFLTWWIRALGVSRRYWILWVGPVLLVYTIATGMRPSAVRACVMALAFGSAYLVNRRPDAPSAWALAAILILVTTPTQLTDPGFIFSFVVVAGLIRLYPLLAPRLQHWATPDPYRLPVVDAPRPLHIQAGRLILGMAAVSLAAWIAAAPLTAHYFNLIAPAGLLGNLIVIPAAFVLVGTGVVTLVVGSVWPWAASLLNLFNRAVLQGVIVAIEALATVPGSYRHVRSPGIFWIGIWYAFLFGGLWWSTARMRRIGYGFLCVLVAVGLAWPWLQRPAFVQVLNAGDGLAVLITAGGLHALYDTGPAHRAAHLTRQLRAHGVNQLDVLILSQATAAHVGGAQTVLETFPVTEIWCSPHIARSPTYQRTLELAAERNIPVRRLSAGVQGSWPRELHWSVLHPEADADHRRAADAALTIRISRGTRSILLTGGGDHRLEALLLEQPREWAATAWVAGHPGIPESATEPWLEAVAPRAIVLPVSPFDRHGHPDRFVWERLTATDATLWRTDVSGPVTIRLLSHQRRGRSRDRLHISGQRGGAIAP